MTNRFLNRATALVMALAALITAPAHVTPVFFNSRQLDEKLKKQRISIQDIGRKMFYVENRRRAPRRRFCYVLKSFQKILGEEIRQYDVVLQDGTFFI